MLFEKWHGVFHPKGELYAVEESEVQAGEIAKAMAGKGKEPWPVRPVVLVESLANILLAGAVDHFERLAKEHTTESAYLKEAISEAVRLKQAITLTAGMDAEKLRQRMQAAYQLIEALTEPVKQ